MPFTLYILRSTKTGKFYVGHTNNLNRRIVEHNSGQTKSTSTGIPWQIVYTKDFDTNYEANKAEIEIKKMKSKKFIEALISGSNR